MRDRRRRAVVAVAAAGVVLLSGCADIPTSGVVHVGRRLSASEGLGDVDVRVQPPQAQPGMTPTAVVLGFLRAVVNNDGDYEIARSYLTPHAAQTWQVASITTYDDGSVDLTSGPATSRTRTIQLQVSRRGIVDARGEFTPGAGQLRTTFRLVRVRRDWRIDALPQGALLSTSDSQRALRLATLYFVDRTHSWLVPQQVLLRPEAIGFTTALARALLAGPGAWLAPAVHTGFPRGVSLLGNVAVGQDGTAEVNLSGAVRQASRAQLQELAAQVAWTLSQDPQVLRVRLLADGSPLTVPDAPVLQTRATWADFDPAPTVDLPAFFLASDGWRSTTGGSSPSLRSAAGLSDLAMTSDGRILAAVGEGSGSAQLLTWHSGSRPAARLSAEAITAPATDRSGDVFVAVHYRMGSAVVGFSPDGRRLPVDVPRGLVARIRELSISPDGSRVAVVAGSPGRGRLLVGRVVSRPKGLAFEAFRDVLTSWSDVRGAAWDGAEQLVATAADEAGHRRLVAVDSDGYAWRVLSTDGVQGAPVAVAVAPGRPLVVLAGGAVWVARSSGGWRRVGRGQQPGYPG